MTEELIGNQDGQNVEGAAARAAKYQELAEAGTLKSFEAEDSRAKIGADIYDETHDTDPKSENFLRTGNNDIAYQAAERMNESPAVASGRHTPGTQGLDQYEARAIQHQAMQELNGATGENHRAYGGMVEAGGALERKDELEGQRDQAA